MNIFYLSKNTKRCARYHCDKHCIKMILELTQLLYTCLWLCLDSNWINKAPLTKSGNKGYKKTHINHPCAIWVRESIENYRWLCKLGIDLCKEYTHRYGRIHACQKHIEFLQKQKPKIPEIKMTKVKQAMPDKYKCKSSKKAYRNYYINEKARFCKWTNRNPPKWFIKKISINITKAD